LGWFLLELRICVLLPTSNVSKSAAVESKRTILPRPSDLPLTALAFLALYKLLFFGTKRPARFKAPTPPLERIP
jgi:hypothetical protein